MTSDVAARLKEAGIGPSAQRVAVAQYVLQTSDHPSAEQVWIQVKKNFPMVSRATIYNTLNLFVAKGLLHEYVLTEGRVVFDPNIEPHHHFIDEASQRIVDIPWDALDVSWVESLKGIEIERYQVVMTGRQKPKRGQKKTTRKEQA